MNTSRLNDYNYRKFLEKRNTVIIRNVHTGDTHEVELIEETFTWQKVYKVRWNGMVETISTSQGWYIV